MTTTTKPKRSMAGIELVRLLAYEGDRIFTTDRARELAPRVGLSDDYVLESLHHLRRNDWIVPLRRGLYALSSPVPGVAAVHEFEVAMALVQPAAISQWSALNHHGLTEQIPRQVFVLTTTEVSVPRKRTSESAEGRGGYPVNGTVYQFVQVRPERYFGVERVWMGDARVSITDLERTLLDGLAMPQYCGGFGEVIHAFGEAMDRLDVERIAEYAQRLGLAVAKRAGWVLERQGCAASHLDELAALPIKGHRKLDPTGPRKGAYNNRWMLQENLTGMAVT
jgi:predicted transcriptional regulator of viral defense system